jgi:8-oxo-dGTP diphosphatase
MADNQTAIAAWDFEAIDWDSWTPRERATLLFVVRDDSILLIHKKRGLGAGKVNGPGGRLSPGEDPIDGALREVWEEVGVTVDDVEQMGELSFQFTDGHSIHCHVFRAGRLSGRPRVTDEATPFWVPLDEIPYQEMWDDDRLWLPLMLQGRRFLGRVLFDGERMVAHEIVTV